MIWLHGNFNQSQMEKITKYQYVLQKIDWLQFKINAHSLNYEHLMFSPESWDQLAIDFKNRDAQTRFFWDDYFRSALQTLKSEIVSEVSGNNHFFIDLTKSHQELFLLEQEILRQMALCGFKEQASVGSMRTTIHQVQRDYPQFASRILQIRRLEKDFMMRRDSTYSHALKTEISRWKQEANYPVLLDDYLRDFKRYERAIHQLYDAPNQLIARWKTGVEDQQIAFKELHQKMVTANLMQSIDIQKTNAITRNGLVVFSILVSLIFTAVITRTVRKLQHSMEEYIRSDYQESEIRHLKLPRNEFGKLTLLFIKLVQKINQEVKLLEDRVARRTSALQEKNEALIAQHAEIEKGMRYAKDLKKSILPTKEEVQTLFDDFQLFFQSKDIVGGDFYWTMSLKNQYQDLRFFALADCTGHGVPGALLSVIGMQALDEIVNSGVTEVHEVLNQLKTTVVNRLNRNTIDQVHKRRYDGMDIALISLEVETGVLKFAGANLSAWILTSDSLIELKGQRIPIGWTDWHMEPFYYQQKQLMESDKIILFSDGFCDQFGGERDKKLGKNRLRKLLWEHRNASNEQLSRIVRETFLNWKGNSEQTDDCTFVMLQPQLDLAQEFSRLIQTDSARTNRNSLV